MPNPDFQRVLERFFESYYRLRPVNATFIGVHAHDHAWPDWSAEGLGSAQAEMDALLRELAPYGSAALDAAEAIDLRLATGFLRIQQWEHGSNHFQRGNPSLWVGEAAFGLIGLLLTEYAPLVERLEALVARLNGLPAFLGAAPEVVRAAPRAWREKAREEVHGALLLVEEGLEQLPLPPGYDARPLVAARAQARHALVEFGTWLDALPLAPGDGVPGAAVPDGGVAAGEEVLALCMREGHCLAQSPDEVAAYALEQIEQARADRERRAAALGLAAYQEGLAQLAALHPSAEGYLARFQEIWDAAHAHALARDLLTWPEFPIRYVERPAFSRAAAPHLYFLYYRAPAAFQRPPVHEYLVAPLPAENREPFLRANNDSVIKLNHVVHHGGIGHHVQNWHAYRAASRVGRIAAVDTASRIALFCGGSMAEGWACYATTLMQEQGFLTPLEELGEAHGRIRMAARAVVDVRLHQGRFTLDEAARFYEEQAAMPPAAARAEAVKNSMFPGAALMYLMGHDAILALRRDVQAAQGNRFSLRAFHDALLAFGSIPVALAAHSMRAAVAQETSHAPTPL